ETIERMASVTRLRLAAQPNAGKPRDVEGRNIYLCSPEYMASYARRFLRHNVRIVGGCCGTTPEHIRQIKMAVRGSEKGSYAVSAAAAEKGYDAVSAPGRPRTVAPAIERATVPRAEKSQLAKSLAQGRTVLAVEVLPPRGYDCGGVLEHARTLKARGIDVISIPDGFRAGAHI